MTVTFLISPHHAPLYLHLILSQSPPPPPPPGLGRVCRKQTCNVKEHNSRMQDFVDTVATDE